MTVEKLPINAFVSDCLAELAQKEDRLVILNADVAKSVGIRDLAERMSSRFVQIGVSEQDMMLMAAGLASAGFVPIATTFSIFASFRAAEQIRTFIAYPNLNVKILVSHAGVSPAQDGVTHQGTEDMAVIRAIPNMTLIEPFDASCLKRLLPQIVSHVGPVYVRMNREKFPVYKGDESITLGKGMVLKDGCDLAIIACGSMVWRALEAAGILEARGISASVVGIHTIKPIDTELIGQVARDTGAIVVAEEHSIYGGLADSVNMVVSESFPVPVMRVGLNSFAESGSYNELVDYYGLSTTDIIEQSLKAFALKKTSSKEKVS